MKRRSKLGRRAAAPGMKNQDERQLNLFPNPRELGMRQPQTKKVRSFEQWLEQNDEQEDDSEEGEDTF